MIILFLECLFRRARSGRQNLNLRHLHARCSSWARYWWTANRFATVLDHHCQITNFGHLNSKSGGARILNAQNCPRDWQVKGYNALFLSLFLPQPWAHLKPPKQGLMDIRPQRRQAFMAKQGGVLSVGGYSD